MRSFVIFVSLLLLILSQPISAFAEILSVKSAKINLRSGPGENFKIKCVYYTGFPLKVIKRQGDWVQVSDFEMETGWVSRKYLSTTRYGIVSAYKNQKKRVNIRSGPGNNFPVVGQAYYGVILSISASNGDWRKVHHSSGLSGWIKKSFIWGN
jgi:SH3-like domain-containing protein